MNSIYKKIFLTSLPPQKPWLSVYSTGVLNPFLQAEILETGSNSLPWPETLTIFYSMSYDRGWIYQDNQSLFLYDYFIRSTWEELPEKNSTIGKAYKVFRENNADSFNSLSLLIKTQEMLQLK